MRVVMWLGLLVARFVVALAVGVAVPLLLSLLSIVFGKRLQRAAAACRAADERAGAAMERASRRIAGDDDGDAADGDAEEHEHEHEALEEPRRVRVDDVLRTVRAVTPEEAQREAIRAAERRDPEDPEAWAARRAQEEADRWQPPEAWLEREQRERDEREERVQREEQEQEQADRERQADERRRAARRPR